MADERIEVEYIATQQQVLQAFEKLNRRLDTTEKKLEKTGTTSKKAAKLAEGSFAALEKELKDNETALKRMAMGTKEFEAQRAKVDRLRRALKGARGDLGGVAQKASMLDGFAQRGISALTGFGAAFGSMHSVLSSITAEMEHQATLREDAQRTTRTLEQSLALIAPNVGAENLPKAREQIQQQAVVLGTSQQGLANLISDAISGGAKDFEQALELSSATLRLTAGEAETARSLMKGTLNVAKVAGSENVEGALGQILQTMRVVPATDLSTFAGNIAPGLVAATADRPGMEGVTTERAFEMASTIAQILRDETGQNTATTMRQFFGRLGTFAPSTEVTLDDGSVAKMTEQQVEAFRAASTFDERLAMMRADPNLQQQFLETQRESIGKTAVQEIIAGAERAVGFEQTAVKQIQSLDKASTEFTALAQAVDEQTKILRIGNKFASTLESFDTTGPRGVEGAIEQVFTETIKKIDLPGGFFFDARGDLQRRFRGQLALGSEAGPVATDLLDLGTKTAGGGDLLSARDRELVESAKQQIALLQQIASQNAQLLQQQNKPVANPQQAIRPKESPLPAATVP